MKMKDNLLTSVYTSVLITIFTEWIIFNELGFLDASCCNHELRPLLFRILSLCSVSGKGYGASPLLFKWITLRGMRIKHLSLVDYHRKRLCNNLQMIISSLTSPISLTIHYCSNFLKIIRTCKISSLALYGSEELTDSMFQSALHFLEYLQEIELYDCDSLTDASLIALSRLCPDLRSFTNRGTKFTCAGLSVLTEKCDLETICYYHSMDLAEFKAVVTSSPSLTTMVFAECEDFGNEELLMIAEHCPKLQEVELIGFKGDSGYLELIKNCVSLTHVDFYGCSISDRVLEEVGKCLPLLTYLKFEGTVSDIGVVAVAKGCGRLKVLEATDIDSVTDLGILAVIEHCPLLEELNLRELSAISDAALLRVWDKCPLLTKLNTRVTSVTDAILVACCTSAEGNSTRRGLDYFNVIPSEDEDEPTFLRKSSGVICVPGFGMSYTEPDLLTVGSLMLILQHNPHLRQLCLDYCDAVTDEVVAAFSLHCPLLEIVTLVGSTNISKASVESLASNSKHLLFVNLSGVVGLSDDLLLRLVKGRRHFKMLGVGFCSGFTDEGIMGVVDACPGLKELKMSNCSISNRSILYALRHCSVLSVLDVSGCSHLTGAILFEVLQVGTYFQTLDVSGCPEISQSDVDKFIQGMGGLQIEHFKYCDEEDDEETDEDE